MTTSSRPKSVAVVGGGLAGCEAATMIARFGHSVDLYEMKPKRFSPAHRKETFAELVCSNSLGSESATTAPAQLKREMRDLGSVVLRAGESSRVPAGKALGVDRDRFSRFVSREIEAISAIRVVRDECMAVPDYDIVIIATGPLTSDALARDLTRRIGAGTLYFYDSISPIVSADSIDMSKVYFGSRYEPGEEDYLNCPLDEPTYEKLIDEIRAAERTPIRSFEAIKCFEACLPIEVLAERGRQTPAFGPMKPVGLPDPRTGKVPHAVVQLRRENDPTTLYNMVGFQTRLKWGEQKRIFGLIPGLENAEFVRMGSMHRNTYVDGPNVLQSDMSLRAERRILLAGQLTGVEGYVESSAIGQWAGLVTVARIRGLEAPPVPPPDTAIGALLRAITTRPLHGAFAPMNINFGLFPPLPGRVKGKENRRKQIIERAEGSAGAWRTTLHHALGGKQRSESQTGWEPLYESPVV